MDHNKADAKFKFKVNNNIYDSSSECLTGAQVFEKAGIDDPSGYDLILIKHGQEEIISSEKEVCLTEPGVERFRARPRTVTDGLIGGECPLPVRDIEYLNVNFSDQWEFKREENLNLLKITKFQLPAGYNVKSADMIIIVPDRYDSIPIDMAYFKPHISRVDGRTINNLSTRMFGQENYQQWSRHRASDNPWIIGVDCIETHVELVRNFLRKELSR